MILEICQTLETRGFNIHLIVPPSTENLLHQYQFLSARCTLDVISRPTGDVIPSLRWNIDDGQRLSDQGKIPKALEISIANGAEASDRLKHLTLISKPDLVIAGRQSEPALQFLHLLKIPLATVGSNHTWAEPWVTEPPNSLLGQGSHLVHNFARKCVRSLIDLPMITQWASKIPSSALNAEQAIDVESDPRDLISTLFELRPHKQATSSIAILKPDLTPDRETLPKDLCSFLDAHQRVLYVNLGAYADFHVLDIQQIMEGIISAMEQTYIDGAVWITASLRRERFFDVYDPLVDGQNPHWRFFPFVPQRAVLGHSSTRLVLSQCETLTFNEAIYHGVPLLNIDRDHFLNSRCAELVGVAGSISQHDIDATDISKKIGLIVQDVYGTFQSAVEYMQKLADSSGHDTNIAADMIEAVLDSQ